jgi:hypothetical protein
MAHGRHFGQCRKRGRTGFRAQKMCGCCRVDKLAGGVDGGRLLWILDLGSLLWPGTDLRGTFQPEYLVMSYLRQPVERERAEQEAFLGDSRKGSTGWDYAVAILERILQFSGRVEHVRGRRCTNGSLFALAMVKTCWIWILTLSIIAGVWNPIFEELDRIEIQAQKVV